MKLLIEILKLIKGGKSKRFININHYNIVY